MSISKLRVSGLAVLAILIACQREDEVKPSVDLISQTEMVQSQSIPEKYIVVFRDDFIPALSTVPGYDARSSMMLSEVKRFLVSKKLEMVIPERVFHSSIKGFAGKLNPMQLNQLIADPDVRFIEEDKTVSLGMPTPSVGTSEAPQTIPYGIARVGGGGSNVSNSSKSAWIIDTGIDLAHPDLKVDRTRSKSFLLRGKNAKSPQDGHGHGTHVSGTIGAINNSIGVVGVAPNVTLVAVRVLDQNGFGTISGVINGVDYVAAQGLDGDVANMSLGGGPSVALDSAVSKASYNRTTGKKIYFALAAGNSSANAGNFSPARVNGNNIYTISAMDINDHWASFSNFGNPPVDFCAPGVSVFSTWKGGTYNTISGTSMATPHMAGVLYMTNGLPNKNGAVIGDPDGLRDSIPHL